MVSKDTQYSVLMEALKWFRSVLRRESLDTYEKGLFEAVANLRLEMDSMKGFPPPPPLPDIHSYTNKKTLKDMTPPPAESERFRSKPDSTTLPVAMGEYEALVLEAIKKEDPSK